MESTHAGILWTTCLALALAGCAHGSIGRIASSTVPTDHIRSAEVGYEADLPSPGRLVTAQGMRIGRWESGLSASAAPEFFASPPSEAQCWERLAGRLSAVEASPGPHADARAFETLARRGFVRGGAWISISVHVAETRCWAVIVSAPETLADRAALADIIHRSWIPGRGSDRSEARLHFEAARALVEDNATDAALRNMRSAYELAPPASRTVLRVALGLAACMAGPAHLPEGIALFEEALSRHDTAAMEGGPGILTPRQRHSVLGSLGLAYLQKGMLPLARGVLAEAVARNAADAVTRYNLACAMSRSGDAAGAFDLLSEAVARDPELIEQARHDSDFDAIRSDARFDEVLLHPLPVPASLLGAPPSPLDLSWPDDDDTEPLDGDSGEVDEGG